MIDSYARNIDYLRVSVTNRCNLRCKYCMPEEGIEDLGHDNILSLEEIAHLVRVAARIGIQKVRLTGGEPLVRRNITKLIADIAQIPKINDIAITTNGMLFADMAEELKAAGLTRVNFSLDSLDEDKFKYITSRGSLSEVVRSISKALELGMVPIKINTVVMKGINDDEILDFVELAKKMPLHVRFIEFMPVGDIPFYKTDRVVTVSEIRERIEQKYELYKGANVQGNGPAKSYQIRGGMGSVGFISAMSDHFCGECNRIRMTADGKLRSCLFGKQEINVKLALQNHASDEIIAELFSKAIREKPNRHHMNEGWGADNKRKMYQIGG
ncbi:Cyclic pyranopterin monophosphate synthase [Sporomusa ovata DSM 2662]|uniref:GTP 3',8-cyclase n=1 Tax=Sporomusa ovata TaxID=2378 RepID=A0A0U1KW18_9FIRM|nr:GTP 3',8-cyclase MoaA [Sporomusa ovata]EQB26787.1 molybdenum cofactor biosynthesis protein A [Sporomusa ovata DSM 2662]CQR70884.1 Molybdenum cofactor biosynthesis protein MoaA [Sporomusa ovata]